MSNEELIRRHREIFRDAIISGSGLALLDRWPLMVRVAFMMPLIEACNEHGTALESHFVHLRYRMN